MAKGKLIITHGKSHKWASANTISRWVKEELEQAGIDISTFSASCFSGPYFPAFRPEKTPYLETFHAVPVGKDKFMGISAKKFYPRLVEPKNIHLKSFMTRILQVKNSKNLTKIIDWFHKYSQVPNKRGGRGSEKFPKFNKRGGRGGGGAEIEKTA